MHWSSKRVGFASDTTSLNTELVHMLIVKAAITILRFRTPEAICSRYHGLSVYINTIVGGGIREDEPRLLFTWDQYRKDYM